MTNYRTLGGVFSRIKNILFQELAMHYKNKIKFVVALLLLGFLSLSLWHCKTTTTEPAGSAKLSVSLRADSTDVSPSEMISLTATVRNTGDATSSEKVLRWYRSEDDMLDISNDTLLASNIFSNLEPGSNLTFSFNDTAPTNIGATRSYFACVDEGMGEPATADNCSDAVSVTVVDRLQISP